MRIIDFPRAALLALAALVAPAAAQEPPRVVLFEDPALAADRLHYPLLVSAERGYRILCQSQGDEEAVIRGLGFATVPSQIVTAIDPAIVAADPAANPPLCPASAQYPIKVFAADGPQGLTHYLQFPETFGADAYFDRIYIPGCAGLAEALAVDLSNAINADPTVFFQGKIHTVDCLNGDPLAVAPQSFEDWCVKADRAEAETATVMAILDQTPAGVSAIGNRAACASADQFLSAIHQLDLDGRGVQSLVPVSVLVHLTNLSLAQNPLADLAPLARMSALSFLDLSETGITKVAALAPLTTLNRLELGGNAISDIRALSGLAQLNNLTLDDNTIQDLGPLQFLQALSTLSLAGNGLTGDQLEPLTALGALARLDLSNNQIESFDFLGEFPSTLEIELTGNPIAGTASSSFLDLCILHRDSATPFGQTIRALLTRTTSNTCRDGNDALLAITTLDLSGQMISDLRPLAGLTHLTALDLSQNAIVDVMPLEGLASLLTLNVSTNSIADIRPLARLTRLTSFEATGNPIVTDDFLSACVMRSQEAALTAEQASEIGALLEVSGRDTCFEAERTLRDLSHVDLAEQGLSALHYVDVMEKLGSIDVSRNNLETLAPLASINGLTSVRAGQNQITNLNAVLNLRRLTHLSLDGNPLNSIAGINTLNRLESLQISGTGVRSVQPLVDHPTLQGAALRNLDLSYGSLAEYCVVNRLDPLALGIDRAFMTALENQIVAANIDPADCVAVDEWARGMTVLTLNKKSINSVAPVAYFTALEELYLFDNLIADARPIASLRNLRKLNLADNRLPSVPTFASSGLTSLHLNNNQLQSVEALASLSQLKTLTLRGNRITSVQSLFGLSNLDSIDVRDNRISVVQSILGLHQKAYLGGNPVCSGVIFLPEISAACSREPFIGWHLNPELQIDLLDLTTAVERRCPPDCMIEPRLRVQPGLGEIVINR